MRKIAVNALLLMLCLPSAATQAITIWEPDGSGNGYFGGNGTAAGGGVVGDVQGFDILNLTATQSRGELTISILTNFSEGELLSDSTSNVVFGDLMLATGGDPWHPDTSEGCGGATTGSGANSVCDTATTSGTHWNYVVQSLHPGAPYLDGPYSTGSLAGNGAIYSVANANLLNSNDAGALQDGVRRNNQYIGLGSGGINTGKTASETIESVLISQPADPAGDPSCTTNPDVCTNFVLGSLLTYHISLADLDILAADYKDIAVAIRWTMTCANDIVEGSLQLASVVPEPASWALLLAGLASFGLARRSKRFPKQEDPAA